MDPIMMIKKSIDFEFKLMNLINKIRYIYDYKKYKKVILKNIKYRDRHNGEVCYIIGNGPSIKNMDLSVLSNKKTFMVNASINTELFDIVKPNYHCIYDKEVLKDLKEDLQKAVLENKYNTEYFLNRKAIKEFIEYSNVNFIYSTILPVNWKIKYDLTRNSNVFNNVVPFAIMCAIYMGFKKIVLLGCDFSFFASRKQNHFYDVDSLLERKETLYQDLIGSSIAWQQYNCLNEFAKKRNIEIINATPNSLLDVFKQDDISNNI